MRLPVLAALSSSMLLSIGCEGERVAATSADAGQDTRVVDDAVTDVSTTEAADGGACDVPGNLVVNGSFEKGGATAIGWNDSRLTVHETGGADCARWVSYASVEWERMGQLGHADLKVGTVVELSAWVKSVDGQTTPVELYLSGNGGEFHTSYSAPLSSSWIKVQASYTIGVAVTQFTVGIGPAQPEPRAVGIDGLVMRIVSSP